LLLCKTNKVARNRDAFIAVATHHNSNRCVSQHIAVATLFFAVATLFLGFNKQINPISESYNKGDPLRKRRREFNERMDGMGAEQKGNKAYPKPYRLYNGKDHYGDKIRIFAKCVSSARAHEMMDIMLMTQSL
jgi:hypothetical protein